MSEQVVLVDQDDVAVGEMEKLAAHSGDGHLHRAISVFVFGSDGRLLLQRRARDKHHFRGLWANTACSHPRPGETVIEAGERRLREEMGLTVDLRELGSFVYRAVDPDSGLVEHEFDHVLVGISDDDPRPDLREADAWDRVDPAELAGRLAVDERGFVPWLRPAFEAVPALAGR
jgi:isopentenyl-diphosphate delta-isomerase